MSDFREFTSELRDFSALSTSARVGSAMDAVELSVEGGGGWWEAAEDE